MPKLVEILQEKSQQYGGVPLGSVAKRHIQQQSGRMRPGGQQLPPGNEVGEYCGDNICQEIERTTGGCPIDCR